MQLLSQAPVEVAAKKYDFRAELQKKDNEFSKEKVLFFSFATSYLQVPFFLLPKFGWTTWRE